MLKMGHNAVVRSGNGEVIGKLSVSKLQDLPNEWEVIYGNSFISRGTDLKKLLCDGNFPLSIYTAAVDREITVKSESRGLEEFKVIVGKNDRVSKLKMLIYEKTRIKMHNQKLYYDEEELRLHGSELFDHFLFQRKGTIRLELKMSEDKEDRVEGLERRVCKSSKMKRTNSFKSVDLQAEHVQGAGVCVKNEWEGYSLGLNVYGTCPKPGCSSHKIPRKLTTYRAGYGFLRIDLKLKEFPCPACKGKFPPGNFVVSSGRALFRFRKMGGRRGSYEVESTLLESFGGINNYAMFHDEGPEAEYDLIEVKTVKEDESLHVCVRCDKKIEKKADAVLYECSHVVHRTCMEETCCVCRAKVLTDAQVKALASSSHQQSELILFDPIASSSESESN